MKKQLFLCVLLFITLPTTVQSQPVIPIVIVPPDSFNTTFDAGNHDLIVQGPGRVSFAAVIVQPNRDFIIGTDLTIQTVVAVDGAKTISEPGGYLGNVVISSNSRLEVFGNTNEIATPRATVGSFLGNNHHQVVNMSTFTDWRVDDDRNIRSFGVNNTVFANDNYLAAAMIHQRYTGWHAVRDHMISGSHWVQPKFGYHGQAGCSCTFVCMPVLGCKKPKTRGAWANYVRRDSEYRSSYTGNNWYLYSNGVQLGTDFFQTRTKQFGMLFGYENSAGSNRAGINFRDRITSQDYYVGLYGVHVFNGGADLRTIFNFGWQNHNSSRHGNDSNVYRTRFNGNTAEVNVELGKRHYFGGCRSSLWSIRPAIALDWYLNQLHGGVETPTTEHAIRYSSTNYSQLFFRFGTDLRFEKGRGTLEGGVYYSYDMLGSDFWARASSVDGTNLHSSLVSSKQGRSILSANLGGSYLVGNNFTLFGGYRAEVIPEQAGRGFAGTGYAGGAWRW